MQRITKLSTKHKSSQTTKDSQSILEIMAIIQEAHITADVDKMVEEAIITKVDTKIILQEDQDVGYVIKITILVQNAHTKLELI